MSTVQVMKVADFNGGEGDGSNGRRSELPHEIAARAARQAKTGLRLLMAVISSLFFLFIIAFLIRSQLSDWQHLSAAWKPLADPWQLWINTAMLLLASVFLQWSRVSIRKDNAHRAVEGLLLAGLFSLAFIIGQLLFWQQLHVLGYYVAANPANSFFYLLTGLHAVHLLGGLVAWLKTSAKAWRGASTEQLAISIELCAMYWHYLLALWLVLLALLTSSPEAYAAFARLCGLQ
jgi:cytochrome c oxidase subunit 3